MRNKGNITIMGARLDYAMVDDPSAQPGPDDESIVMGARMPSDMGGTMAGGRVFIKAPQDDIWTSLGGLVGPIDYHWIGYEDWGKHAAKREYWARVQAEAARRVNEELIRYAQAARLHVYLSADERAALARAIGRRLAFIDGENQGKTRPLPGDLATPIECPQASQNGPGSIKRPDGDRRTPPAKARRNRR